MTRKSLVPGLELVRKAPRILAVLTLLGFWLCASSSAQEAASGPPELQPPLAPFPPPSPLKDVPVPPKADLQTQHGSFDFFMGTSFGQIGTAPTEGEKKETANDWMAQIRSEQKDKQDTLAYWDGRIRVHPQEAGHYFERGRLRAQLAKDDDRAGLDAAIADFSRAVELEPKHAEALCQRGFLAWRKKELNAALADFCRVIELVPDHSTALIARGQVYLAMEDFDRAITDFDRAAAIRPGEKDSPTLIGRAQCFAAKGEYRRAIDDLRRSHGEARRRTLGLPAEGKLLSGTGGDGPGDGRHRCGPPPPAR